MPALLLRAEKATDAADFDTARKVFGPRVLESCEQARQTFAKKYDVRLPFPVQVDMLPTQQDSAVRTFSLPGGEGFLGVCFGPCSSSPFTPPMR